MMTWNPSRTSIELLFFLAIFRRSPLCVRLSSLGWSASVSWSACATKSKPEAETCPHDFRISVCGPNVFQRKRFRQWATLIRNAGSRSLLTLDNVNASSVPFAQRFRCPRINGLSISYATIPARAGSENAEIRRARHTVCCSGQNCSMASGAGSFSWHATHAAHSA